MSTIVLTPLNDGTQRFKFRSSLGGSLFTFEFFWNARDQSWSYLLSDAGGNLLLSKKLTINTPQTFRYSNPALPKGELLAYDSSGANLEPGLNDLGSRVLFAFTDVVDLP